MKINALIQKLIGKMVGINKLQEEINSLYYYLNTYTDISNFPQATGDLRKLQVGDTWLLKIFDLICKKKELEYWLDSGTLLGAVRHGGFIPWDDDIDVCMDRLNYEKALDILPRELERFGIDAGEKRNELGGRIGIGYKHEITGIWMDIFPVDYSSVELEMTKNVKKLRKERIKCRKQWVKYHNVYKREEWNEKKKKIVPSLCSAEKARTVLYTIEFYKNFDIWDYETIFPLEYMSFEGHLFSVPRDTHTYLKRYYGDRYGEFPRSGLTHHGDENGALFTRANRHKYDMNNAINELESIYNDINFD